MLPFMYFKMQPSQNKFHHQGLSYTKLCRGVCVSEYVCAQECASRFQRSHLQRIWPYGRQHIYPERERESKPGKDCVRW